MTALNGAPELARDREQDIGGLAGLPGLEPVAGQLGERIAVLRAELARRQAGLAITRPAWKNLVFTGGPGTGKSRAARAVARVYRELGLLSSGHLDEVAAASMVGTTPRETGIFVGETVRRATGGIVMIPDAHAWSRLPDCGQQVLRRLYQELTERRDDLAVILAGQASPLRDLLRASPPLAARFPAVIDFPGYTAGQLAGDLRHPGRRGRVHPHPRCRAQGRLCARPGRRRPPRQQRPARCPTAGPGHRQPGPSYHHRSPAPGPGHAEHH